MTYFLCLFDISRVYFSESRRNKAIAGYTGSNFVHHRLHSQHDNRVENSSTQFLEKRRYTRTQIFVTSSTNSRLGHTGHSSTQLSHLGHYLGNCPSFNSIFTYATSAQILSKCAENTTRRNPVTGLVDTYTSLPPKNQYIRATSNPLSVAPKKKKRPTSSARVNW